MNSLQNKCIVCGDSIDLTAQVCGRYCMRVLEQLTDLDSLDKLEAQVSPVSKSDYETPTCFKIVPEQRAPAELFVHPSELAHPAHSAELFFDHATSLSVTPPHRSY